MFYKKYPEISATHKKGRIVLPFKDEAQNALFQDPVLTAQ
jgi:hypothetical protein